MRRDQYPIYSAENFGRGSATEEAYSENQLNSDVFVRVMHSFTENFSGTFLVGMDMNQRILYIYGATYGNFLLDVRNQSFLGNATSEHTQLFDYQLKRRNSAGYATINLVCNEYLFLNASGRSETLLHLLT